WQSPALQRHSITAARLDQVQLTERRVSASLSPILQCYAPGDFASICGENQLYGMRLGVGAQHLDDRQRSQPLGVVELLQGAADPHLISSLDPHSSQEAAFRVAAGLDDLALGASELRFNTHALGKFM